MFPKITQFQLSIEPLPTLPEIEAHKVTSLDLNIIKV